MMQKRSEPGQSRAPPPHAATNNGNLDAVQAGTRKLGKFLLFTKVSSSTGSAAFAVDWENHTLCMFVSENNGTEYLDGYSFRPQSYQQDSTPSAIVRTYQRGREAPQ